MDSYAQGFGRPEEEHWIGLEAMHLLTSELGRNKLRIDMVASDGDKYYIVYEGFMVGDASEKYRMSLGNKLEGNATDVFGYCVSGFFLLFGPITIERQVQRWHGVQRPRRGPRLERLRVCP